MKKYIIGYTQGTFDLFHIGHLNLLNNAKKQCDYLIVGVNSDKLVVSYKGKNPVVPENDRIKIVESIKCVDSTILCDTLDKNTMLDLCAFNVIFIGNDWEKNERWIKTKEDMKKRNVDVIFLPYTDGISSTILRKEIENGKN